ncbi:nucleotidyl transferase AbiEii/AbiGii toxin family protein [Actinomyces provencensis]|uniref:nucleotidyl transferase AbiEii/AbiGii toxin family protein n=1 Tax=Actinomyces provencensis TaxID=1720198 RepID=UPI00096A7B89|nr:nucleotidyl transferase AbiEii/AbiGii toxin family protein [Actinomyces provencensis]
MRRELEEQRRIARLALEAAGEGSGFALAGSGAIREHGLIDRPTEDVDLFTVQDVEVGFGSALERIIAALQALGHTVDVRRRQDTFAQLTVTGPQGHSTDMDLGVDWRAHRPVRLEVGPVLAIDDAVGNKVAALFSRAEARDYLDMDAIRRSGRYSDEELLDLARKADAGFDLEWFAQSLDRVERIQPEEVRVYRVTPDQLAAVKTRMSAWATDVRSRAGHNPRPVRDGHHTPTPGAGG